MNREKGHVDSISRTINSKVEGQGSSIASIEVVERTRLIFNGQK